MVEVGYTGGSPVVQLNQQIPALTKKVWVYGKEETGERQQCLNKSFAGAAKQNCLTVERPAREGSECLSLTRS